MTKEAQRRALAQACPGWRVGDESGMSALVHWIDGDDVRMLSDPLEDLNATRAMLAGLNAEQQLNFILRLKGVLGLLGQTKHWKHVEFDLVHATAAQYAEAFLREKGLWAD